MTNLILCWWTSFVAFAMLLSKYRGISLTGNFADWTEVRIYLSITVKRMNAWNNATTAEYSFHFYNIIFCKIFPPPLTHSSNDFSVQFFNISIYNWLSWLLILLTGNCGSLMVPNLEDKKQLPTIRSSICTFVEVIRDFLFSIEQIVLFQYSTVGYFKYQFKTFTCTESSLFRLNLKMEYIPYRTWLGIQ